MRQIQLETETPRSTTLPETLLEEQTHLATSPQESLSETATAEQRVDQALALTRLKRKRFQQWSLGYLGIISVAAPLLIYLTSRSDALTPITMGLLSFLLMGGLVALGWKQKRWTEEAKALAKLQDKRTLGAFIEMMQGTSTFASRSQNEAKRTLIRLLEQIQPVDAGLLNESHRKILRVFLGGATMDVSLVLNQRQHRITRLFLGGTPMFHSDGDIPLAIAAIQALSQIGNQEDLRIVEAVSEGIWWGKYPDVKETATACLPQLRQHVEVQSNPQLLLRASAKAVEGGEDLLRAAQEVTEADGTQLLRAADEIPGLTPQHGKCTQQTVTLPPVGGGGAHFSGSTPLQLKRQD